MTDEYTTRRWASAWPDVLAFALGLGVARLAGWTTTDLVWSLWLSSFAVGYAIIVWTIIRPGLAIARGAQREWALVTEAIQQSRNAVFAGAGILVVGGLFMLAFFTVHFGGFHYVHSQFLIGFFPIDETAGAHPGTAGVSTYLEVARRYWQFLPSAFLAERAAFTREPSQRGLSVAMTAPYRNVMRMHGLIFFFALAHFAGLDSFAVYAVVYAVYFFPWRLLRTSAASTSTAVADWNG